MADPIPRNSRAHETEEFRQARVNRDRRPPQPLGQNVAGVHRFRPPEPAPAQPQRPQAQPARAAEPRLGRLREMMSAARPAQAPPWGVGRADGRPQRRPMAVRPRLYAALQLIRRNAVFASVVGLGLIALVVGTVREPEPASAVEANAVFDPLIPGLAAAAPVAVPPEVCDVAAERATFVASIVMDGQRVVLADVPVRATGCAGQLIRAALWVYRAPDTPLTAPSAPAIYRGAGDQLTVQGVLPVDSSDQSLTLRLMLPHAVFPTALNSPMWLTMVTQAWPDGRPASAGSRFSEPVFFERQQ